MIILQPVSSSESSSQKSVIIGFMTLLSIVFFALKSTCDVNLLSKLSITFKEWRVIVLCTFKVPQGANNLILCTLDTIHRFFFCYKINN